MNTPMLEGLKGYTPEQVLRVYISRGFDPKWKATVGRGDFATYHYSTIYTDDLVIACTHRTDCKGRYVWSGNLTYVTSYLTKR